MFAVIITILCQRKYERENSLFFEFWTRTSLGLFTIATIPLLERKLRVTRWSPPAFALKLAFSFKVGTSVKWCWFMVSSARVVNCAPLSVTIYWPEFWLEASHTNASSHFYIISVPARHAAALLINGVSRSRISRCHSSRIRRAAHAARQL